MRRAPAVTAARSASAVGYPGAGDQHQNGASHPADRDHAAGRAGPERRGRSRRGLVYVPHTTAGVTINEGLDPDLARDIEAAMEKIVEDGWGWRHEDADGPNAPSHMRASLMSPEVLVPLAEGKLKLGRYQGIFFCEFDGPRERKIYVTSLR